MTSYLDLTDAQIEVLAKLYAKCGTSCDDLPYTAEFEELYALFLIKTRVFIDRHGFWRALVKARKAGRLSRKERAKVSA
jgi:hypothetical protein